MCLNGYYVKEFELTKDDAIVAYRAWQKINGNLSSLYFINVKWDDKTEVEANYLPEKQNDNGLYSFKNKEKLNIFNDVEDALVFGKIIIWGKIIEHEHGYRSQFAQIVELTEKEPTFLKRILNWVKNHV